MFYFVDSRLLDKFCVQHKSGDGGKVKSSNRNTNTNAYIALARPQHTLESINHRRTGGGGGAGFPSHARVLGECSLFLKVEINSRKLIPLFMPGLVHSGSAN